MALTQSGHLIIIARNTPLIIEGIEYRYPPPTLCFCEREVIKMPKESRFQADLIKDLKDLFPGCFILKNDSSYLQGIPDLLILFKNRWAALEVKRGENEPHQPNQDYYVEQMDSASYAAFIYPENKEDILYELQQALRPRRAARVPQRQ